MTITTYMLDFVQHLEVWKKLGYFCYAKNTATNVETYLGFIAYDASPKQLINLVLADGTYDIIVRMSGYIWREVEYYKRCRIKITGGVAKNIKPVYVSNGGYLQDEDEAIIEFDYLEQLGATEPTQFGIWIGAASPVDTSGAPDYTINNLGNQKYRVRVSYTVAQVVAIRSVDVDGNKGEQLEITLPVPATTPDSPSGFVSRDYLAESSSF